MPVYLAPFLIKFTAAVPIPHPISYIFNPRLFLKSANSMIWGSTKCFLFSTSSKYSFVPFSNFE